MKTNIFGATDAPVMAASLACAVILATSFVMELRDDKQWKQFKADHECKVVSRIDGQTVIGSTTGGNVVMGSASPQSGWLCDNGITYLKAD